MARVTVGGDPERYMDAPQLTSDDSKKGPGGFIASLLDAVGIGRQVAKEPQLRVKGQKSMAMEDTGVAGGSTQSVPAPVNLPSLDIAESALGVGGNQGGDWGKEYLKGLKPLTAVDPSDALKGF